MPTVESECPECGTVLPIEEDELGTTLKCPKCKFVFPAGRSAGAYGFAEPLPRPRPSRPSPDAPELDVEPDARPETDAERRLRERMEKWADD